MTNNSAILDDIASIKNLDKGGALISIELFPKQCEQAWREVHKIDFPANFSAVKNIVVAGMGGSSYGARIVKSLYDDKEFTKIPLELTNGYHLPGYVSKDSLVILSSYSGGTEETLYCGKEAKKKQAKITGITSGGSLAEFLHEGNYTGYIFNPEFNPSKQPRLGGGYMTVGLIALLQKLGKINVSENEVTNLISLLEKEATFINQTIPIPNNYVKKFALELKDKIPVIIVADFLDGAAYAIRNPFHETSKQFGLYFTVPELNHHLLEGLRFPEDNQRLLKFIFIKSSLYDEKNRKRIDLTQEIVAKNNIETESIILKGSSTLEQTMELIQIGAYLTFYLAMINGVDPSLIPWVDYFKEKMKRN